MAISEETKKALASIHVVRGKAYAGETGLETGPEQSAEEEWLLHLNGLKQCSRTHDWEGALNLLTYLSTREGHPKIMAALAQRAWLALKAPVLVTEVTLALSALQMKLGLDHPFAAALAALAFLMAQHRSSGHPEQHLAQQQAQQMLQLAAESARVAAGAEFEHWIMAQRLDDPDYMVPLVMNLLTELIADDWWIDAEAVQRELEQDISEGLV
ncbi:MAG: hypothetical protein HQL58_11890 [Magnetococcales bacterium]|nr:hypothetical protein [Magnetococcales bacterium]